MGPVACLKFLPKCCPYTNVMQMMNKVFFLSNNFENDNSKTDLESFQGCPSSFIHFIWHPECKKSPCISVLNAPLQTQDHAFESYCDYAVQQNFPEKFIKKTGTYFNSTWKQTQGVGVNRDHSWCLSRGCWEGRQRRRPFTQLARSGSWCSVPQTGC